MKKCPQCSREYDNSMSFCLDDGAELLYGPASMDEPATAILSESGSTPSGGPSSESRTRAQLHTTAPEAEPDSLSDATERQSLSAHRAAEPRERSSAHRAAKPLAAALLATLLLVGGYFGYKYLSPRNQIDSIAVMPFVNASGNVEFEYLSDGMTETLINSLSQIGGLSVKGRSSVFRYKGKDIEPQQIARELGVESVLSGRVVQRGDSITLSLELTEASTGNQLWGEQYVRKLTDIIALQREIARDVSDKLKAKLTQALEQQLANRQPANPEAYQLYLQGRFQWNKRTNEGVLKAEQLFQQAIERDPEYALAYVGLADSYVVVDRLPPNEANPKAKAAALRALQLDPTLGEAHAVLANCAFYYEWDWPTAEREYKRAIELSPNHPTTYHWYAETLSALGRFDESAAQYQRAQELDPLSLAIATDYGFMYFSAREYDRAIEHLKRVIETDPTFVRTHHYLATVYEEKGMFVDAIEARKRAELIGDANVEEVAAGFKQISDAYRRGGPQEYWETVLKLTFEMIKEDPDSARAIDVAGYYAKLNNADKAFEWLEKGFRERRSPLVFLKVEPTWDNIRSDPRFAELVRRVGIP